MLLIEKTHVSPVMYLVLISAESRWHCDTFIYTSDYKKKIRTFFFLHICFSCVQEAACAYVIALMAVYWCTEVLPLAVTALLPTILFPMLGIMESKDVRLEPHRVLSLTVSEYPTVWLLWLRCACSTWRTPTCSSWGGSWWLWPWSTGTYTNASHLEFCCWLESVLRCEFPSIRVCRSFCRSFKSFFRSVHTHANQNLTWIETWRFWNQTVDTFIPVLGFFHSQPPISWNQPPVTI